MLLRGWMQIGTKVGYSLSGIRTMYKKGVPRETRGMGWNMRKGLHMDSQIKFLWILVS